VAKRITAAQRQQAYKDFQAVLEEQEPDVGRKFRRRRKHGERFAARQFARFQAEGGEEGTGKPFKEWLKNNWKEILAQLFSFLIPLITGGAA
jgi:hypothetical protein